MDLHTNCDQHSLKMRILLPYVQAEISFLLARAHEENIQVANMIQFINY